MKLYGVSYTISILFVWHADFEYIQHTNVVLINKV